MVKNSKGEEKQGISYKKLTPQMRKERIKEMNVLAERYALSQRTIRRWLEEDCHPHAIPHTESPPFLTIEKAAEMIRWSVPAMRKACQRGRASTTKNDELRDCFIVPAKKIHLDTRKVAELLPEVKRFFSSGGFPLPANAISQEAPPELFEMVDNFCALSRTTEDDAMTEANKKTVRVSLPRLTRYLYSHPESAGKKMSAWIERTESTIIQAANDLKPDPQRGAQKYSGEACDFLCPGGSLSDWFLKNMPPPPERDKVGHQARLAIRIDRGTVLRLIFPKQAGNSSRVQAFLCRNGTEQEIELDALAQLPLRESN